MFKQMNFLILCAIFTTTQVLAEPIKSLYPVEKDNLLGFINETGELFVEPTFDVESSYFIGTGRDDLIIVNKNGKRGIINLEGKLIIPTEYDDDVSSFDFNRGKIAAYTKNGSCGYITDQNQLVINNIYEKCNTFYEGRAAVKKNNKWGVIDQNGKLILDFIYDEIDRFSEGLAAVRLNGKYGYIDKNGQVVINIIHDMGMPFEQGIARIGSISSPYYFINSKGEKLFDVEYDHVYPFIGNYAVVRNDTSRNEFYGVIDKTGKTVVKPKYSDISLSKDWPNLALIEDRNGKSGILDLAKNIIIMKPKYEYLSFPYKGLAYFKIQGKYGWMNENYEVTIPANFDEIRLGFGEKNMALVESSGEVFYINRTGEKISNFNLN
ncbi:WG repeat-containing protein [Acinetobacter baumannii]|uniref:WG repeat-containing protein n=3 Tax=Acinetobacter baumannii TaxID=470 RepID=UPI0029406C71|nr:WG repeat-containing protein [Acinetobacter baumannii]MDV4258642.1 WG repeat-containing protein [Acinetobacter baumannii]